MQGQSNRRTDRQTDNRTQARDAVKEFVKYSAGLLLTLWDEIALDEWVGLEEGCAWT